MALRRYKLGQLTEQCVDKNEDNLYGSDSVVRISVNKELAPTKANLKDVSLKNFIVVKPKSFVYAADTSRRGDKISLAYNSSSETYLASNFHIVFRLNDFGREQLLEEYLFMYFNRSEFDRYARMHSWGSARERFYYSDMSDVEIELPPIEVQRKYVAIYEAMLANQRAYEKGLDDLKLTCDALLDRCKKSKTWEPVGKHLREVDVRNADGKCDVAYGINIKKEFMLSKASSDDLLKYKLVKPGQIACNLLHVGRDASYPIAVNETGSCIAVSPAYSVFIASNTDMALFLMAWFSRAEIGRNGWFICDDSIRGSMAIDRFLSCEIPIPDGKTLKAIAELRTAYWARARINVYLKAQLKDICPVLIRGSVEEASR